jgi:hypothetical protein
MSDPRRYRRRSAWSQHQQPRQYQAAMLFLICAFLLVTGLAAALLSIWIGHLP